jgi:hypothetical protein
MKYWKFCFARDMSHRLAIDLGCSTGLGYSIGGSSITFGTFLVPSEMAVPFPPLWLLMDRYLLGIPSVAFFSAVIMLNVDGGTS